MKKIALIFLIVPYCLCFAQMDAESLVKLSEGTTAEMNAITAPNTGSLLYNSSEQNIFYRDASSWQAMTPVKDITTSDTFLAITNTGNTYDIETTFRDVKDELIFDDANFCYISMVEDSGDYLVIRYDKADVNVETRSSGTGSQPNTLVLLQGLTYN